MRILDYFEKYFEEYNMKFYIASTRAIEDEEKYNMSKFLIS
jgi:hypothetical protein